MIPIYWFFITDKKNILKPTKQVRIQTLKYHIYILIFMVLKISPNYIQISKSYLPPTRLKLSSDMLGKLPPNWEQMVVAFWYDFAVPLAWENTLKTSKLDFGLIEKSMTATGIDMKSRRKNENLLEVIMSWGLGWKMSMFV